MSDQYRQTLVCPNFRRRGSLLLFKLPLGREGRIGCNVFPAWLKVAFKAAIKVWASDRLLGICFLREGFEAALGPERRGEKGGYAHDEGPVKVGPTQEMDISMLAAVN